jgi:hypothetical protein
MPGSSRCRPFPGMFSNEAWVGAAGLFGNFMPSISLQGQHCNSPVAGIQRPQQFLDGFAEDQGFQGRWFAGKDVPISHVCTGEVAENREYGSLTQSKDPDQWPAKAR